LGWMAIASVGLTRVALGLCQIRGLRRNSSAIDSKVLAPETQLLIEEFRKSRPVSVLVSPRLDVPTAVGFFQPAVILPAWMVESLSMAASGAELHHAVLHELAHLRRRDDWTNLVQKLVKAVLFFHPGVWWVERKLSLDREMACDDAVLAQTASARAYAECLAHLAEKSFLRRKLALAQAAVDRVRQLSLRVARILNADVNRSRTNKLWKPALPLVAVIAAVCTVSTSPVSRLVSVVDQPPAGAGTQSAAAASLPRAVETPTQLKPDARNPVVPASWQPSRKVSVIPARYTSPRPVERKPKRTQKRAAILSRTQHDDPAFLAASYSNDENSSTSEPPGFLLMVVETRLISSSRPNSVGTQVLQINTWEVRWCVPATPPAKQIPRKT